MDYEIFQPDPATSEWFIRRASDGAIIPIDAMNRDYQEFLVWNESHGNPITIPE